MGSACSCVAGRDRDLPNRNNSEVLYRSVGYSPSWSFRWDNRGRVAGEIENPPDPYSRGISGNGGFVNKGLRDIETEDVSDGGSPLENLHSPVWQKSPIHDGTAGNLTTPASDLSMGSSFSTEVKDFTESTTVADPSASKLSFSLPTDSTPSRWARRSPGHHLSRGMSDSRISESKSLNNNSMSEGRPSFVLSTCSNDITMGSQGRSPDGWSMRAFTELVASSQRERWSFDSDTFDSSRGKITRSNSHLLASPSVDIQTCGMCSKLLTEKSSWSSQKIITTNELSVVAVLVCGHVYHAECLDNMTYQTDRYDPSCPVCVPGVKHTLKISGKASRVEADSKLRNSRVSRNRVVDGDLEDDSVASDHQKGNGKGGKGSKLATSLSLRSSFAGPFLRRHFSLGMKSNRSLSVSESSTRRKGFWARYLKE